MHLSSRAPGAGRAALLATILAACGGAAPTAPPTQPPPTDGEPTATAEPTAVVTTAALETTVWYAGFKLTFDTATAMLVPDRGGTLAIDATFENLGTSTSTLDATIVVSSAGSAYEPSFETDLPTVPGTASGKGTIVFEVDGTFTLDDAVMTLGTTRVQQAIVPIGSGELVALEPVPVAVTGTATAGTLQLDVTGAEIRYDLPDTYTQAEAGKAFLRIDYSATFNSDFAGGFAFVDENVALRLPDGTTVAVRQDGRSHSIELLQTRATTKDLFSRFDIDAPIAGDYVFLARDDGAEGELPFTVTP